MTHEDRLELQMQEQDEEWLRMENQHAGRLHAVFDMVLAHNAPEYQDNWKQPIAAVIPIAVCVEHFVQEREIRDAVEYFTGSQVTTWMNIGLGVVYVTANGYWADIGA